ncbi:IS3 family transposase [Paraclostridium sordellii]|uniref:IS3 family transposase n=1 Tax=Paraclostridium sordellii TaxID=1505 RepID=UPI001C6119A9|nr:transposase [Paeniclostridium sordellii]
MPKPTKKVISNNKVNGIYKYRKLNAYLEKKFNIVINHNKIVYSLMKYLGIKSKIRSKR